MYIYVDFCCQRTPTFGYIGEISSLGRRLTEQHSRSGSKTTAPAMFLDRLLYYLHIFALLTQKMVIKENIWNHNGKEHVILSEGMVFTCLKEWAYCDNNMIGSIDDRRQWTIDTSSQLQLSIVL